MKISGERLEELRISRDWTQDELAREARVSRDTVSKLESGARKRAHGPTVGKLAQALGVGPMELCGSPSPAAEETQPRRRGANPLAERYRAVAADLARETALGELMQTAATMPVAYVNALVTNARALQDEERYYYSPDGPDGDRLDEQSPRDVESLERKHALLRSACRALDAYELDLLVRIAGHLMAARLAMAVAEGRVRKEGGEDHPQEARRRIVPDVGESGV